jgi:hypothetical protein
VGQAIRQQLRALLAVAVAIVDPVAARANTTDDEHDAAADDPGMDRSTGSIRSPPRAACSGSVNLPVQGAAARPRCRS